MPKMLYYEKLKQIWGLCVCHWVENGCCKQNTPIEMSRAVTNAESTVQARCDGRIVIVTLYQFHIVGLGRLLPPAMPVCAFGISNAALTRASRLSDRPWLQRPRPVRSRCAGFQRDGSNALRSSWLVIPGRRLSTSAR